jgi:hypothetical protein
MNNSVINTNFPITVYGNLEKFTDTMSIGRVRIFYKYGNRNGTYITDEFAESLVKTLPYTPVKGIYEDSDYTDHGLKREEGRIYGIVPGPQDMNFAWEKHVDADGVEREYACVNVYYYTALYEEAGEIDGKGQSMELYKKSITCVLDKVHLTRSYRVKTVIFSLKFSVLISPLVVSRNDKGVIVKE